VGGFIPSADVKGLVEPGSMNFIFGGNGFFGYFFAESDKLANNRDSPYDVSEPGESLAWWSTYEIERCPDRQTLDMTDVTRQLRERHASWKEPVVQKVVQFLRVENMYPTWTSPALPTWQRDGVVLVGDAAHALPSSSGQGSSQALEDVEAFALFLAHSMRKGGAIESQATAETQKKAINAAAKSYMVIRQPHVKAILDFAQRTQDKKREMGIIKEYSMYAFMRVIGKSSSTACSQFN
jgi:2-polyprenyl-6-methoxyphenol hydroxylase-like FAD-dependent oxidoreductase